MTTYAALPRAEIGLPDPAQWMDPRSIGALPPGWKQEARLAPPMAAAAVARPVPVPSEDERAMVASVAGACRCLACRARRQDAARDDARAWDRFYPPCAHTIRRLARHFRVPRVVRKDFSQTVWVQLIQVLPDFQYDACRGQFCSWLHVVVKIEAAALFRRMARRRTRRLEPPEEAALRSREPDPALASELASDAQSVKRAIAELRPGISEADYRLLRLRLIDGASTDDVAMKLGMPAEQVRYRYRLLGKKLRVLLDSRRAAPSRKVAPPRRPAENNFIFRAPNRPGAQIT